MDQTTVIKMAIAVLESGLEHEDIGGWAAIIAAKNMLIVADDELKKEHSGVRAELVATDGKIWIGGDTDKPITE